MLCVYICVCVYIYIYAYIYIYTYIYIYLPSLLRLPPTPHPNPLGNHRIIQHQAGLKQVSYINAYTQNLEKHC